MEFIYYIIVITIVTVVLSSIVYTLIICTPYVLYRVVTLPNRILDKILPRR